MTFIIRAGIFFLNIIYTVHKLFPVKNRISVISRQSDSPSMDVTLLFDELRRIDPSVELTALYRMVPSGMIGRLKYIFHMIGPEMHLLATSRVIILEGYTISVSILNHRKDLQILQMWHAMGALKKFGHLSLDTEEGSSRKLAEAMRMHKNYTYILSSSEYCRPIFAKAFNYDTSRVKVMPLPRTDLLLDGEYMKKKKKEILSVYPELREKLNILYVPTFRKTDDMEEAVLALMNAVDYGRYNLIVKLHPLVSGQIDKKEVKCCPEYSSMELFSVADYVISDYSAIIFEAAAAGKPLFFYTYDLERYLDIRGFSIDFVEEMPGVLYKDPVEVIRAVEINAYDRERQKAFAEKFIKAEGGHTRKLALFVYLLYNGNTSLES